MKKLILPLKGLMVALMLSFVSQSVWAENTKQSVASVSETVTLTTDVDYIITSATPFDGNGKVNIANTEHAVLILQNVKPSVAISKWLGKIQIDGAAAVNNTNCQVKLYNRGCIILPYGTNTKPLTVYSEKNFQGTAVNNFGLEHSGGYMNTLTTAKLNNKIRSFKLKRGYMVTFSLRPGGRGYSRCFIAADRDLEVASLPSIMDMTISSYRIFTWYDTGKQQLAAAGGDKTACSALNVTSTYTWGTTQSMLPDVENVPHHIYENYPSPSSLGACTSSPHMKTNNEPMNPADDPKEKTESVDQVLANWEDLMRTGMRLCSPSSWDGSDYTNGTGYIKRFIDSIDARGWRCDIIDLHCYWPEGNFGSIKNWTNSTGRPVWISEWVWGASWNNNGAFASNVTEAQNAEALKRIIPVLNNNDCIERYYYWNGERDPSRLYKNGSLTEAGQYYASVDGGVGYNGKYNYIPKTPKQYAPSGLTVDYDKKTSTATLKWHESNGELNQIQFIERKLKETWERLDTIDLEEAEADYTYTDQSSANGCSYRVVVIDATGKTLRSTPASAISNDVEPGDPVMVNDNIMYVGGNIFVNGDFDMGVTGWVTGAGTPLSAPDFQVVPVGGYENSSYLQFYGTGASTTAASVYTSFSITPQTNYYFSGMTCNTNIKNDELLANELGVTNPQQVAYLSNQTGEWLGKFTIFNSGTNNNAILSLAKAEGKLQVDRLLLAPLFDKKEDAIADGIARMRQRAEAFVAMNTRYAFLNSDLTSLLLAYTGSSEETLQEITALVKKAISAYDILSASDVKLNEVKKALALNLYDSEKLSQARDNFLQAQTIDGVLSSYTGMVDALEAYLPYTSISGKVKSPKFTATTGWTTKCGTYTGGDQRTNKVDNVSFWNAWWSGVSATDLTQTMAVKQAVTGLDHGLYAIECKASTQHFCLSDQHGYIDNGEQTENTNVLTADYMDLPTVDKADRWQTLLSAPVYVPDGGSVTIGFESSKNGAMGDQMWREVGKPTTSDNREGWWGATDFVLKYVPVYKASFVKEQLATICLPYAIHPTADVTFYQIAGVNSDYTKLCLEEVAEPQAGYPYIIMPHQSEVTFMEYGKKGTVHIGACNLWGQFKTTSKVFTDYYALTDGVWKKVTDSSTAPAWGNYSAAIAPFTGTMSSPVPVIAQWDGLTMSIEGVTDAEIQGNNDAVLASVDGPMVKNTTSIDGVYTLDGRSVSESQLKAGLYIKIVNGRAYKTIVK